MLGKNSGKIEKSKKGFTLIEILVVIFVLGIGLVGAMSFFNINLNNQFEAKQELIAAGLAQEGADLARNIVDHSYLNPADGPWYWEFTSKKGEITIDYCSSVDRDVLFGDSFKCRTKQKKPEEVCFNPTSGVYSQKKNCPGNQVTTDFKRILLIEVSEQNGVSGIDLESGDCIKVTVTVTWNSRETKSIDIICKPRQ